MTGIIFSITLSILCHKHRKYLLLTLPQLCVDIQSTFYSFVQVKGIVHKKNHSRIDKTVKLHNANDTTPPFTRLPCRQTTKYQVRFNRQVYLRMFSLNCPIKLLLQKLPRTFHRMPHSSCQRRAHWLNRITRDQQIPYCTHSCITNGHYKRAAPLPHRQRY